MAEISMQRGFRGKLGEYFDLSKDIAVSISAAGADSYDSCCFGVDSSDKLSDDRYMIFYNQTSSPNREIVLTGGGASTSYTINLSKLPAHVRKLVFTASIDGEGTMGRIQSLDVKLWQGDSALALRLNGSAFRDEKAVIAVELYMKDTWRIAAVASGFNGGLPALLKHFGGEEDENIPAPAAPAETGKVSLEKRLEKEAPQLVSLVKPLKVSLEKHNLSNVIAQVALLIDISGSMSHMFSKGTVQSVVDKIVPLAMQFDDNGEFELWYFGTRSKRMPSVTIKNYTQATSKWQDIMSQCGGGTDLSPAIADVIKEYKKGALPAYVLCITDGATSNGETVKKQIFDASGSPIFWQFIGIGQGNYGILDELGTMPGRQVVNANFFTLDDIGHIDNTELYSRMLARFPDWLKEAKRLRILK